MDTRLLRPQFHWFSPVCMLIALFAGLLFALGHHVFYDKLDGSEIPTGNYTMSFYDSGISKQQSNIAIGTALAFAVKTSFVLAVSTAYFQLFWRSLVGPSSRQPSPLHAIDKAHSALRDATVIINFRSWKRFPLLLTLGLITWYCKRAPRFSDVDLLGLQ